MEETELTQKEVIILQVLVGHWTIWMYRADIAEEGELNISTIINGLDHLVDEGLVIEELEKRARTDTSANRMMYQITGKGLQLFPTLPKVVRKPARETKGKKRKIKVAPGMEDPGATFLI